jgi:methyl-accepting chemotaxis protein
MRKTQGSVGCKLLAISAGGTTLVTAAAGYGLWRSSDSLHAQNAGTDTIVLSLILMVIAAILAFAAFYWTIRTAIVQPAKALVADLARMAGGDFAVPIEHTGSGEFAQIAASAENIRVDLGLIVRNVQGSAKAVATESAMLAEATREISRYSDAQSGSANSIASDIEKVAASINSIAESTEVVRHQAAASLSNAHTSNEKLSELVGEIDVAESAMGEIEAAVAEFLQSTRSIIAMTQQVRDIADQTNLLALNAAIEAARAGEQGRGFAVVADEVRKLAEKSAQSASQIDEVTRALSQKSESVEQAIRKGRHSLQSSQEFMENVAVVLSESNQLITQATDGVENIAVSVKEQDIATQVIGRNIDQIAQRAEEGCKTVARTAEAVRRLNALSGELEQSVHRIRA